MQGTVIAGRYTLLRLLGKGAMGAVWLANDAQSGKDVAVKRMDARVAGSAQAHARFLQEARLAARIENSQVAQVFDHGTAGDGTAFLAMEYLVGTNLRARLMERGRLSVQDTERIVSSVCRGLACAHEVGLVHRDLKPENIFLANGEGGETVKILDFGVAKATDVLAESGVDSTSTGDLLGTPYYMSPEQAQGLKIVDRRADLWSVGVVAFECMTGVRPFEARALGPLIGKILAGPIAVPSKIAPDARIGPAIDAWMLRALARGLDARFQSARELSDSFTLAAQTVTGAASAPDESAIRTPWEAGDMNAAANAAIGQIGHEIFRYLAGILGDPDIADEAFSAFCERVWSSMPRFEWRCSFRTWAYVIARRACSDVVRVQGRRRRRHTSLSESRVSAIEHQVRTATLPLLKTEGRSALERLRDDLPHEDKMLLILRVDRGLAWEDLARVSLDKEQSTDAEVRRESARLRKRFQLVKERLRERARQAGLIGGDGET